MLLKCLLILSLLAVPCICNDLTEDEEAVDDPDYKSPYAPAPKAQAERLSSMRNQPVLTTKAAPTVTTTKPSFPKREEQLLDSSQEKKDFWDSGFDNVYDVLDYVAEEGLFNIVYKEWRLVVLVTTYRLIIVITVGIALAYCFLKHEDDEDLSTTSACDQSDDDSSSSDSC